jgi:hypothetical protein
MVKINFVVILTKLYASRLTVFVTCDIIFGAIILFRIILGKVVILGETMSNQRGEKPAHWPMLAV